MTARLARLDLELVHLTHADDRDACAAGGFVAGIFDVELAGLRSGLELLAELRATGHAMPALVVTSRVAGVVANWSHTLGAGYVVKQDDWLGLVERFVAGIVADRRVAATPSDDQVLAEVRRFGLGHGLSPRETEVLGLVATRHDRCAIADQLGISVNTLKRHVRNLLAKLATLAASGAAPASLADVVSELRLRADRRARRGRGWGE